MNITRILYDCGKLTAQYFIHDSGNKAHLNLYMNDTICNYRSRLCCLQIWLVDARKGDHVIISTSVFWITSSFYNTGAAPNYAGKLQAWRD